MKRMLAAVALCVTLTFGTGCIYYQAPVMPPQGLIFTSVEAPMDPNVDRTRVAPRSGSATSISIFSLIAFGDASMATAARNGNLSTVDHLDYKFLNVFFLFQSFTTVAHGE